MADKKNTVEEWAELAEKELRGRSLDALTWMAQRRAMLLAEDADDGGGT